jgi:hypothetical protein
VEGLVVVEVAMSEKPRSADPPDDKDPHDPLWRARVEMAEHARDPDVAEERGLDDD